MEKFLHMPAVLGIGNALVDVINILEDDFMLEQFNLPRGSMTLVDRRAFTQDHGNNNR
jgi:hypothetical protein